MNCIKNENETETETETENENKNKNNVKNNNITYLDAIGCATFLTYINASFDKGKGCPPCPDIH